MQFNLGLSRATQGLGDLVHSIVTAGDVSAQAQRKREGEIAQMVLDAARARKAQSETAILDDRLAARQGLGESLGPLLAAAGADESLGAPFAGAFRASGGNVNNLGDAFARLVNTLRQQGAVEQLDAGNREGANIRLAASGRTPLTPFTQTSGGLGLNTATGEQIQTSPAAEASIAKIVADAAAANALAGERERAQGSFGQPIEVTGPDGLPLLVQFDKAGNAQEVEGFLPRERGSASGDPGIPTAVSNAIARQVARTFKSAIYSPLTGEVRLGDPQEATAAIRMAALAEQIWKEAGGRLGPSEAALMAVTELQTEQKQRKTVAVDPAGIRKFVLGTP